MGFNTFINSVKTLRGEKTQSIAVSTKDETGTNAFTKAMRQPPEELEAEFILDLAAALKSLLPEEVKPNLYKFNPEEKTRPAEINVIVSHPAAKPKPVADTEDIVKHQSAPTTIFTTSSDFSGKAVDVTMKAAVPTTRHVSSREDFEVIRILGQGDKSKVFLALNTQTEQFDALKITPKAGLSATDRSRISNEHRFGKLLGDCPWTVGFKDSFEDSKNFYTVTDYCSGNSLRQRLVSFGSLTESAARLVAAELIVSVESLHKRGIVHGDIKLDNILIDEDGHLVFTGFGRAVTSQEHAWGQRQPSYKFRDARRAHASSREGRPPFLRGRYLQHGCLHSSSTLSPSTLALIFFLEKC
ncbi:kinase-like domain-containing protein [Cytidiella melzeri]|nr:kinase-like domain-containing protein [Cytidiella melzeri]